MAKSSKNTNKSVTSKAAEQPENIVYVVSYRYSDRHGSDGANIVGVFRKKEDAKKAKSNDIKNYLLGLELLKSDGTFDIDSIVEIDGDSAEGMTLEDVLNANCIDVDGDGTWCEWSIAKKLIR